MSVRFFFVRHGQSSSNLRSDYYNDFDAPLTDLGKAQAARVGYELKNTGVRFKAVFCSPYQRAIDTCKIALLRSGDHKILATIDDRIGERRFDGLIGHEATEGQNRELCDYSSRWALQNGVETLDSVERRARKFIEHVIREYHEGDFLLFSHGIFGLVFRAVIEGRPKSGNLYDYVLLKNGGIEVYEVFDTIA